MGGHDEVQKVRALLDEVRCPLGNRGFMFVPPALAAESDLDFSFGNGGIAYTGFFGAWNSSVGVAVQVDGKIILVGHQDSSGEDFVARFLETPAPAVPVPMLSARSLALLALLLLAAVRVGQGR